MGISVMYQSDVKIFELITLLKELGKIQFDYEFCESIEIPKQSIPRIKKGIAHFTARHIENICNVYEVNANWIFEKENNVFNNVKTSTKSKVLKQIQR